MELYRFDYNDKQIIIDDADVAVYESLVELERQNKISPSQFQLFSDKLFADAREVSKTWAYQDYMQSTEWAEKRNKNIEEYGGKCFICGSTEHLQSHHLNYYRVGCELDSDLVCLCRDCHMKLHQIANDVKEDARQCLRFPQYTYDKRTPTPQTDAWFLEMRDSMAEIERRFRQMQSSLRKTEALLDGNLIDEVAELYIKKIGSKTIKKHLPRIASIIIITICTMSDIEGIEHGSSLLTQAISQKLKKIR